MGVGVEDAVAVKILEKQIVPPVPNYREPDPELGTLNLSQGGHYPVRYALRLAAGFGSQIAMTVLRRIDGWKSGWRTGRPTSAGCARSPGTRRQPWKSRSAPCASRTMGSRRASRLSRLDNGYGPRASVEGAPVMVAPRAPSVPVVAQAAPAAPRVATAPAAVVVPSPAPLPPAAPAPVTPAAASGGDAVMETVLRLVSEKTGYPRDMLDPDLDLEADLGIDTVKQAEVFALVRESFGIPRQDTLKLRDYPTLRHVVGFVRENRPDLGGTGATATAPATAPATTTTTAPATAREVSWRRRCWEWWRRRRLSARYAGT